MRQRATIAIAVANEPRLLLVDEPHSSAELLELLADLKQRLGAGMIVMSRYERVTTELADEVYVLSTGRLARR
jgi:ABC-type glutathione transport system ATPase component